jgi:hypothetical protein
LAMGRKYGILARCGRGAATVGAAVAVLGLRECAALHGRMAVKSAAHAMEPSSVGLRSQACVVAPLDACCSV